ncbi:MAG: hypothetical protein M3N31_09265, partial [Actinomycetota bacterium]|nr:hypothetical protein [Actinomycetota bacterium]
MRGKGHRCRVVIRLAALAALVVTAGCGDGDGGAAAPPAGRPGPPPAGETGGPLTGLPVDPSRAGRPLLIVKVDNAPK